MRILVVEDDRELNRQVSDALVDAGYVGHINVASGFGRWVEGYELARQVAERADRWHVPS